MAEHGSSPYINHFIQPDTVVPNPSGAVAWNRYSYVKNNPIRYNDPTGHCEAFCVLVILLVSSAVLMDLGDNGQVDTLMPDGFIYSGGALDSTGLFMTNTANPKELPLVERDVVFTPDQAANFNTQANSGSCPHQYPCVSKPKPYPTIFTPNADLSVSAGLIWSQNLKKDTEYFSGDAYNITISTGAVSVTAFTSVDKNGRGDYNLVGLTVGKGVSPFPDIGAWYSNSIKADNSDVCIYIKARKGLC